MNKRQAVLDHLSPDLYLTGNNVSERYTVDWSAEHACTPDVVLRPRSTEEVSEILSLCHAAKQPVVVQGGMTGLSGGATPQPGEWALSLERLNEIVEVDTAAMTITVDAGIALETIQNAAEQAGLQFPLDLGARGSCLAGGIVATNAGGNQVIEYGMTRAFVLGLVVVLSDGTVIPARNKLLKNNAGFDVKQLFIGSEGALGVITEVTFRLYPRKRFTQTALCALNSYEDVMTLLKNIRQELDSISAFEVMWSDYYQEALRATGVIDPLGGEYGFYTLIETEGANETAIADAFEASLFNLMEDGLLQDAAIVQSRNEAKTFWAIRDGIAELMPDYEPAAKFDIGIPIKVMDEFANQVRSELRQAFPGCRVVVFGHIGDGNLHLVVTTGKSEDVTGIYDLVYRRTCEAGGTITAEHGIGVHKKDWLHYCRSDAEINLMQSLKELLDPEGIINPGRVV